MYGTIPFYRQLTVGSTGPDVRQLNRNLAALDYADGRSLGPAGTYTAATALAVERWQEALGVSVTGVFGAGDAIVSPGPIRVTSVTPLAGQQVGPGQVLLTATGVARQVHVNLDVTEQTYAYKGELVRIQLPFGATVNGRITSVGHVASSASGSNTNGTAGQAGGSTSGQTIPVNISILGSTAALGGLDQAPVTVDLVQETLHGVLTVPIDALQAEPGGGSAVTTVGAHGQRRLVRVKAGLFASGRVQISGPGITAGTKVEVASL
jgi:peptidoglycan hydrolase-like protein with peptidoglycan-binding domain